MNTVEECYEYVLKRCNDLAAQRRRKRETALKAAAPVCGIAVIAGAAAVIRGGNTNTGKHVVSGDNSVISSELNCAVISVPVTVNSAPKHENKINIDEVEIAEDATYYLFMIPPLYEMTRDEVLEHFGLSTEFDLSRIVDGLRETAPRNGILNIGGKHGFCRGWVIDENGIEYREELHQRFEHDEFVFESTDGTKTATVIFDREERVNWLRSGIMCSVGNGHYSTEPFYALPASEIAGVEMRIARRSIGGYYAEFNTETLAVGLIAEGLSEEETVNILEYLAEYVGSANPYAGNIGISVDEIEMSYPELIF